MTAVIKNKIFLITAVNAAPPYPQRPNATISID